VWYTGTLRPPWKERNMRWMGIVAARGRLFLAGEDGSLACFAK